MDKIKVAEKNKEFSKDESYQYSENAQRITDNFIKDIDLLLEEKEKDILTI